MLEKQALQELVSQNFSAYQIAEKLNCSTGKVRYWCQKHRVYLPKARPSGLPKGVSKKCIRVGCSKKTTNPKFCSKSCAAKHNNKLYPKRSVETKCRRCDNFVYKMGATLCKECYSLYSERYVGDKTLADYKERGNLEGKHSSWAYVPIRHMSRSMYKDLLAQGCANCGYDKHVEICHVKAISSFPDSAKVADINGRENIVQLCRNCHWELDHGLLATRPSWWS